jgi:hypothetical protein
MLGNDCDRGCRGVGQLGGSEDRVLGESCCPLKRREQNKDGTEKENDINE